MAPEFQLAELILLRSDRSPGLGSQGQPDTPDLLEAMKGQPSAEPREVTQIHSGTLPKSVEFSFSTPNSQTVAKPLPGPQHCAKLRRQNLMVIYTGSECQSTSISVANAITASKSSSRWVRGPTHSPVRIAVVIPSISNSRPSPVQSMPTCRRTRQGQAAAGLGVSPEQRES